MVKIKRKVEMTLSELIEWGFKQKELLPLFYGSKEESFVQFTPNGCVNITGIKSTDTFTVEVEEELTEGTKIPEMLEIFQDNDGTQWFGNSIEQVKDDFSREFWLKDGDTMTLIWKDGELVGDE
ncbi:hypothetical protein [Staphylococcus hominis]|uniref:Phage protein n=1 Tax=Staphylococcus phage HS05 TaxID=3056399 RepID=A0AA50AEF5_9VIRU|nr:hypothetical protein [Staphylococcus hominis]MBC3078552.1 hypothetical protein [Staphylococcus hominis]WLJ25449.1 MAG: hypothetical protein [Staphylococcus phage HS05]